jgi:hypothetical protein
LIRGQRNRHPREIAPVIVITGPGRAGTSFLAMLYRELGFNPGGRWNPLVNAGMEAKRFADINMEMASALGTVAAPGVGPRSLQRLNRKAKRLPAPVRKPVVSALDFLRYDKRTLDPMDWSQLDPTVEKYGDTMRALSLETEVVKDPRFCWTLQAWLASGASISSIVLALRPLDAMAESRIKAGWVPERARPWATNNFAYGIGLALSAASEYRVPVEILRFPDFLAHPRELYAQLPLPEERSWDDFHAAFVKLHDHSLVHDRR